MKKIIYICIFCFLLFVVGCSNKNTKENEYESVVDVDAENEAIIGDTKEEVVEKQPAGYYKFNENVLIGYGFEMILRPDGTIVARGRNNNGELGNGTLVDSYEWTIVEGLEGIKQIACAGDGENATIYALKEDGTVWWWGSEQVRPKQLDGLYDVEKFMFKNWGSDDIVDHYRGSVSAHKIDGSFVTLSLDKYKEVYNGIQMDDYETVVVQNSEKCFYILNGDLYEYNGTSESMKIEGVDNARSLLSFYRDILYLLTESGEVYGYDMVSKNWQSLGGSNIEKIYQISENNYSFLLNYFKTGTIMIKGDNRWGEVGNGTNEPYKSQPWEIQLPMVMDVYSSLNGKVFAIDDENNLWAWGNDYTYEPQIQYCIDDVVVGNPE